MQIFLSYASEDQRVAEEVRFALLGDGYQDVFFDMRSLLPGGNYHEGIRDAIKRSDLMIFLISPNSVEAGCYALTELKYAEQRWAHPKGRVLPVLVRAVPLARIPSYLKAVTIVKPEGNVGAEVVDGVRALRRLPAETREHRQEDQGFQTELSGLRRAVSAGSRLLVSGCALAAVLALELLLSMALGPDQWKNWGRGALVLAAFSIAGLTLAISATGWAGWAFLSHAQKMMHRLEFEARAPREAIRTALSGSSLISASTGLVRTFCWGTLLTLPWSGGVAIGLVAQLLGMSFNTSWAWGFVQFPVLELPYLFVGVGVRVRYFNPENWLSLSWPLVRAIKRTLSANRAEAGRRAETAVTVLTSEWAKQLGVDVEPWRLQQITDTWQETLEAQAPRFVAEAMHVCLRKYGMRVLLRWGDVIEDEVPAYATAAAHESLAGLLETEFPELAPDARTILERTIFDLA